MESKKHKSQKKCKCCDNLLVDGRAKYCVGCRERRDITINRERIYFDDDSLQMMKEYVETEDEMLFNVFVYPVLYRISEYFVNKYSTIINPNEREQSIRDNISVIYPFLRKLDFNRTRQEIFYYLCMSLRNYYSNEKIRYENNRERYTSLDELIDLDGSSTMLSVLQVEPTHRYYLDHPEAYKQFMEFWNKERVGKIFGHGQSNVQLAVGRMFRNFASKFEGKEKTKSYKPRGTIQSAPMFADIVYRMRKEMEKHFKMPVEWDSISANQL